MRQIQPYVFPVKGQNRTANYFDMSISYDNLKDKAILQLTRTPLPRGSQGKATEPSYYNLPLNNFDLCGFYDLAKA